MMALPAAYSVSGIVWQRPRFLNNYRIRMALEAPCSAIACKVNISFLLCKRFGKIFLLSSQNA